MARRRARTRGAKLLASQLQGLSERANGLMAGGSDED